MTQADQASGCLFVAVGDLIIKANEQDAPMEGNTGWAYCSVPKGTAHIAARLAVDPKDQPIVGGNGVLEITRLVRL